MLLTLRKRIALAICPELGTESAARRAMKARAEWLVEERAHLARQRDPTAGFAGDAVDDAIAAMPEVNVISALVRLVDDFQQNTALSDWEVATRAGVNNRAVKILRRGSPLAPKTAAKLFEYLEEAWPEGLTWPLDEAATRHFGTVLTIPAIEKVGGPDAMLDLIRASGRKRTIDAVRSWASRSGMPEYARYLAKADCTARGIELNQADFEPSRLTPAQITNLRPKKEAA